MKSDEAKTAIIEIIKSKYGVVENTFYILLTTTINCELILINYQLFIIKAREKDRYH